MSLFDWYIPTPTLHCPVCDAELTDWQGRDGPTILYVWQQGVAEPVEWRVDEECRWPEDVWRQNRLPAEFDFATGDQQNHWINARGRTEAGVWTTSEISLVRRGGTWEQLWPTRTESRPASG
jgi:hypothetical protein